MPIDNLVFNTGVNAPVGFSLTASYTDNDFAGTTNPALFDSTTTRVGVSANLRLSPSTQGTLSASYTDYVSGATPPITTESQTTAYNVAVSHDLASSLTLNGNIGYREKDSVAGGPVTESGFFGGVDLVRDLPDGTIFGGVNVDDSGSTTSTALTFGRTLDLPDGSLTASLEVNNTTGSGVQLLGKAAYQQNLPTGSLSVDLNQSLTTNTLDQDVKVSSLGILPPFKKSKLAII